MKYKKIIKSIIIVMLYVTWIIVSDFILNKTHNKISLPLGLLLLNIPLLILLIYLIVYFKKKLNKKKNIKISENICMILLCIITPLYFIYYILPLFLDVFSDLEKVELVNAEIYSIKQHHKFSTRYQYYIKGYDAKKGYVSFKIRVDDDAKKVEKNIKENGFTKVYYYKHSKYTYEIITD